MKDGISGQRLLSQVGGSPGLQIGPFAVRVSDNLRTTTGVSFGSRSEPRLATDAPRDRCATAKKAKVSRQPSGHGEALIEPLAKETADQNCSNALPVAAPDQSVLSSVIEARVRATACK